MSKHADAAKAKLANPPEVDVFFDQTAHGNKRADVPIIYLVWGVFEFKPGSKPISAELRAVTSYLERAEHYKRILDAENEHRRKKYIGIEIETSWLNHLYGHSMFQALYPLKHDEATQALLDEEEHRGES